MSKNKLFVLMAAIVAIVISVGFYGTGNDRDKLSTSSYPVVLPSEQTDMVPGMTTGANMPTYSYHGGGMSFTRNDTGWVFVVGGDLTGAGVLTTKNDRYNVKTNTWTTMAPFPTAPGIWYTSGASIGTMGYICGGLTGGALSNTTTQCTQYNFLTNTWTVRAPMPAARAMCKAVGYQDSLVYVAGGFDATGSSQANVYLYNQTSNTWRAATSLPASRMGGAFSRSGDTLVYVNGTTGVFNGTVALTTYRGVISQADRSVITWTTGTNYPGTGRYRQDAQMWGCKGIVLSGGASAANYTPAVGECYVYSPGANAWTVQPSLITTRTAHVTGSVTIGPGIWKFVNVGGFNGANVLTTDILTDTLCPATPLCEQFTDVTFPPAGWTRVYTGTPYWIRATQSAFGLGSGSAQYDMWNASSGINQSLITPTFPASDNPLDAIKIDFAYSPYPASQPYSQDSLIINVSNNGGSTWTSLVRLGPLQLQTVPSASAEFIPTASSWVKRNYPLPVGTNKIEFFAKSQFGNRLYLDSICFRDTLVGITPIGIVANEYSLSQNYPNPFNPTTTITYNTPNAGLVKLVVFDILGREVATLVNGYVQKGTYDVVFDAAALASGVYFYKLTGGDFNITKKMLLIK